MRNAATAALLTTAFLCCSSVCQGQVLTPAEVESAVAAGLQGAVPRTGCEARGAAMGVMSVALSVRIVGPMGHVMGRAAEAKRLYKSFSVDDVTGEMLAPLLRVVIAPNRPAKRAGSMVAAPLAQHVVLRTSGAVIQPESQDVMPASWSNLFGATIYGQGLVATFQLEAFRNMPGEEVQVVIVTDSGERRCTLPIKNRSTFR